MAEIPLLNRGLLTSGTFVPRAPVSVPASAILDMPERAIQFGTGGFLRGFVEFFIDNANIAGVFNGRIVAVSTTASGRDGRLLSQDCLYTLAVQGVEHGTAVRDYRIIGSLSRTISASESWPTILELATKPDLSVIFSNTTEVGIVLDDEDSPDLNPPRSFPGKLAAFLFHRANHFGFDVKKGLTVVPCELIENNGKKLRDIVIELSNRWGYGQRFIRWLDGAVPFCTTLVDRIVPGTPPADQLEELAGSLGYNDGMLTVCEPYRLFVIERRGASDESLSWASADPGILLTDSVTPYRERKVRLLNGGHTILVPLALLCGRETVFDAVDDENIGHFLRMAMLEEIAPSLDAPNADAFALDVLERFGNPFIEHLLLGITLHGTTKMAVRVVPSIIAFTNRMGHAPSALAFGFAAYLLFMRGDMHETLRAAGENVPADDAGQQVTSAWTPKPDENSIARARRVTDAVCSNESLWGTDLRKVGGFADEVASHLSTMLKDGVNGALDEYLKSQLAFRATAS
jgi:Mannitol-1-phosphate/altronate dehydrogenases